MHQEGLLDYVAVCDIIPERAYEAQRRTGVPEVYADYDQMLAEADIDLVVNLTPTQDHTECILKAIEAHKHVYTEKPIALKIAEADQIIERGKAEGVLVGSAPAVMTHPENQEIKQLIDGGQIGKVCFARARGSHPGPDQCLNYTTDPTWFHKPGAGPVIDLGIYPLQALTGLLGPARRVTAFGGIAIPKRTIVAGVAAGKEIDVEVEDNVHILLDFGDACFAYVDATFCVLSAKGPRMEIYGTDGVINASSEYTDPPYEVFVRNRATEFRGWAVPQWVYRGSLNPPRHRPGRPQWSLATGVEHMVKVLQGETELIVTAEHARHTLEIILSSWESIRTGQAIELKTTF
jgi:predicted dehydrogenase